MAVHFIGFRGQEIISARRVWGQPDFIHRIWDVRAKQEIAPGDVAVFANNVDLKAPNIRSFDDSRVFEDF